MIDFLQGKVAGIDQAKMQAVLEVGGVGLKFFASQKTINLLSSIPEGQTCKIFTYLSFSQEDIKLYGFSSVEERLIFELFSSVKGVGGRSSLSLINALSLEDIILALETKDPDTFTRAQGIGRKTAERIVLELKSKTSELTRMSGFFTEKSSNKLNNKLDEDLNINKLIKEVSEILLALGYTKKEVDSSIEANRKEMNKISMNSKQVSPDAVLKLCVNWLS